MEENKCKKNKIRKIFIITGIISSVLGGLFLILVLTFLFSDLNQEKILKEEIIELQEKTLETDNFEFQIKTKGDYAYIEKTIKKYYQDLSNNVKIIYSLTEDEDFIDILSLESLKEDRPNFDKSYETIKNVRSKIAISNANINNLCKEETIKNLVDKNKFSDEEYYYELYLSLIYSAERKEAISEFSFYMENFSKNFTLFLDKIDEILDFLNSKDKFITYSDKIYFDYDIDSQEYNKMLLELQELIDKLDDIKIEDNYYNEESKI